MPWFGLKVPASSGPNARNWSRAMFSGYANEWISHMVEPLPCERHIIHRKLYTWWIETVKRYSCRRVFVQIFRRPSAFPQSPVSSSPCSLEDYIMINAQKRPPSLHEHCNGFALALRIRSPFLSWQFFCSTHPPTSSGYRFSSCVGLTRFIRLR